MNLDIRSEESYLHCSLAGVMNYDKLPEIFTQILQASDQYNHHLILFDGLKVKNPNMSTYDRVANGHFLANKIVGNYKIAFIWDPTYINNLFENVVINRGGMVKVFGDKKDGIRWLKGKNDPS